MFGAYSKKMLNVHDAAQTTVPSRASDMHELSPGAQSWPDLLCTFA